MSVFSTPIPFTVWYSMIGTYVLIILFSTVIKKLVVNQKSDKYLIIVVVGFFILYLSFIGILDFINVKKYNANPDVFVNYVSVTDKDVLYNTWFYDVYICNIGKDNQERKIIFSMNNNPNNDDFNKHCGR